MDIKQFLGQFLSNSSMPERDLKNISFTWYVFSVLLFLASLLLAINQIFSLRIWGFFPIGNAYNFYLVGILLAPIFIIFPATENGRDKISWFDMVLCVLSLVSCFYFAHHAMDIIRFGWEFTAPPVAIAFSVTLWLLVLEGARRTSGIVLTVVCLFFSLYPTFTHHFPGMLSGINFSLAETAAHHAMSVDAIFGVAITSLGTTLIGFLLFGVVLNSTGGGTFFLNLAQSLMGHKPGGPAKVAVLSSALFGSISGSAVANVMTTGPITIPLMKKTGMDSEYSAAVEACASTGGVLAPPIMGAAAFLMASFLAISYANIVRAAIIPSLLFFTGLFFQIDFYAKKSGLKGLPKEEMPSLKETFKEGWYYLLGIGVLVYYLFVQMVDSWAPFYASAALIALSMISKKSRLNFSKFVHLIYSYGLTVSRIVALLAAVGLIVGALSRTGVALSFSRELVVATDNIFIILITGAITSFILGLGMVSVAVYIFLAIVMAPALVNLGVNPLSAHFFVLYWGTVSFITPPVALASFTAAGLAKANPLKTALYSVRLGTMLYIIPFFFVYNPAILAQGTWYEVLKVLFMGIIGVYFIAAGDRGYLTCLGSVAMPQRVIFFVGGCLLLMPEIVTGIIGALLVAATIFISYLFKKRGNLAC